MSETPLRVVEKEDVNKNKALEAAITQIERSFGKGSVMRLGQRDVVQTEVFSTGSINLDIALGIGGLPRGRVVEVYGPESSGKTTLALHGVAEAQKAGGTCAFIDAEHALDPIYAKALVCASGDTKVVMLSLDLVAVVSDFVDLIFQCLGKLISSSVNDG